MSITERLLTRVEALQGSCELWCAAALVGLCVDLGAVTLEEAQAVVDRCRDYDELANRLTVMADDARATVTGELPIVGYPPAPAGRFRIVGELEGADVWNR